MENHRKKIYSIYIIERDLTANGDVAMRQLQDSRDTFEAVSIQSDHVQKLADENQLNEEHSAALFEKVYAIAKARCLTAKFRKCQSRSYKSTGGGGAVEELVKIETRL